MARIARTLTALVLSAKREVWRMHDHAGEADKAFQRVRVPVLEAAAYSCEFCGLHSDKYQEVHHLDDNHANNDPRNLACSCPLCHQVFHVGMAGMRDGGYIISLPELTQAELNQLCLVMWIVQKADTKNLSADQALMVKNVQMRVQSLNSVLINRRANVKKRFCDLLESNGVSKDFTKRLSLDAINPSLIANALMSLDAETYGRREELLGSLRLLPRPERFETQFQYWMEDQSRRLPINAWYRLLEDSQFSDIVMGTLTTVEQIHNEGSAT